MGHKYDYCDQDLTAGLWNTFHTSHAHTCYSWNQGSRSMLSVTGSNGLSS